MISMSAASAKILLAIQVGKLPIADYRLPIGFLLSSSNICDAQLPIKLLLSGLRPIGNWQLAIGNVLPRAGHFNKAHDGANGGNNYRRIEESENTEYQIVILREQAKTQQQELQMKKEHANSSKGKPARRGSKRPGPSKA
jgi:hypothetical protein